MVIDAHLHVLQQNNFDKETWDRLGMPFPEDTPIEQLVTWLNEAGVRKAVIMGQDMTRIWRSSCGEDYVLEVVKRYPDKFIGLASVEPLDPHGRMNRAALRYFEEAIVNHGFRGLLLTPPYGHYYSNDKQVYPFYEKAVDLGVVVQYHHSAQVGPSVLSPLKFAELNSLNEVSIDFPDLTIVVEHIGYPSSEKLFVMMESNENMFADIAMMYDRHIILTWNLVLAKEYGVIDRIIYASDYWVKNQGVFSNYPEKDMKRWIQFIRAGLNKVAEKAGWPFFTESDIHGILWKNAARLYELNIGE